MAEMPPQPEEHPIDRFIGHRLKQAVVRFIQCTPSYKWDQHGNLELDHEQLSYRHTASDFRLPDVDAE